MGISFEGIGQWAATFACADVQAGQTVKISGDGQVSACQQGEDFAGVARSLSRDGKACTVVLGGMVTVGCAGTLPALGWSILAADGQGGAAAAESGRSYRVVSVDKSGKTVTFVL